VGAVTAPRNPVPRYASPLIEFLSPLGDQKTADHKKDCGYGGRNDWMTLARKADRIAFLRGVL
jgi:hypothetical protein